MKKFYLLLLTLVIASSVLNAQVVVTAPSLVVPGCLMPTAYAILGDITINETAFGDISGSGNYILTAPANFEFLPTPNAASVTTSGGDLSVGSLVITATTITFSITVNSTTNIDQIVISGIQVRAVNTPSAAVKILRLAGTPGTATVFGDAGGAGVNHGTLTSTTPPSAPTLPASFERCGTGTVIFSYTSANGTTIDWYDAPTGGTLLGTSTTSFTTPSISTTTIYYAEARNTTTGCVSASRTAVTATISQTPTTANAGLDQIGASTCGLTSVTLAGNNPLTGTGAWSIVSGVGGNITTLSSPTSTFTGTSGTSYTLRWTISNGSCTASTDDVVITFNALPTASISGANSFCTGGNTLLNSGATAGSGTISSYQWYLGASLIGGATSATYTATAGGSYTVKITNSSGCTYTSAPFVITVYAYPPKQSISTFQGQKTIFQKICDGQEVGGGGQDDLDVLVPPPGGLGQPTVNYFYPYNWGWESSSINNYTWDSAAGTNTIYYQHILPAVPSVYSPIGDYYFRFSLTQHGCTTFSDTIHIAVTSTLTITAGPNDTICESSAPSPIILTGANVGGTSTPSTNHPGGTWYITDLTPTNGGNNGTLSNTGFQLASANTIGTTTYTPPANYTGTVTLSLISNDPDGNGVCDPIFAQRKIVINQGVIISTPATASICSGSSTNISLTSLIPSTYTWTIANVNGVSGASGGSGSLINQALTAGSSGGTVDYVVTPTPISGVSCAAITSTITVTVNPAPVTTGATICQGGSGTLTSSASCFSSGSTTVGPKDAGTGVDNAGVGTVTWGTPGNITTPGTPYASQALDAFQTSHYLQATNYGFAIPTGATINGISVFISREVDASASVFDNVVSIVKNGVITGSNLAKASPWPNSFGTAVYGGLSNLWGTGWTAADINNGNFGIVLSATSQSGTTRSLYVDYIQISVTYTINGNLNWYTVSSGGSTFFTGSSFDPATTSGSGITNTNTSGTYPFYVECSSAPGCRGLANFVINDLPAATISYGGSPYCATGTATVNQIGTTGGTYTYTGPGALSIDGNTGTINLGASAPGTYTVTYSFGTTPCNSTTTADITINPMPAATISYGGSPYCATGTATVNQTGTTGGTYSYTGPGTLSINGTTGAINLATSTPGTYTVNYAVGTSPCSITATAPVTINALPTATISYSSSTFCPSGTAPVTVTSLTGGPITGGTYSSTGGPGTLALGGTGTIILGSSTPGTYTITYTFQNANGCFGTASTSVTIAVPVATISYPGSPYCATGSATVTQTGTTGGSYTSTSGLSINASTGTIDVAASTPGTYTVTYHFTSGACSNTTTTSVIINKPPVTTGASICQGGSGTISTLSGCSVITSTAGPKNPTIAANVGDTGTVAWTNINNITIGGSYASASFTTTGTFSNRLEGTNYAFSIPSGATITSIVVNATKYKTGSGIVIDRGVRLLKAGIPVGDRIIIGGVWPALPAPSTYNGVTNSLWGVSWTPSEINNSGFGVSFVSGDGSGTSTAYVADIKITVTYTTSGADWYTVSSGGAPFFSGSSFDPATTGGSGITNTNTPGTTTFYAACSTAPGCRTATPFVITAPTVPGTIAAPASVCSSGPGTLTLSGNTGSVVQWESSTTGGTPWSVISNTTGSLNYTAIPQTTYYRALIQSGACTAVYSNRVITGIHNLWTGTTSSDWNTASNWSDGKVPDTDCDDVYIPGGTTFEPVLSGAPTATITNLHIQNGVGASVTINGTGLMQIRGTISNSGIFDVSDGILELNGTSPQNINANTFQANAVKDLVISNAAGTGVTLGGPVDVYHSLTYGKDGAVLNTGGYLTLKSKFTETAWIGDMTNHTISGNVTVERYINSGMSVGQHSKAWEFVAVPTTGQSIFNSWMEGGSIVSTGYGTQVTGPGGVGAGFDAYSVGPSMKYYDPVLNDWVGVTNTANLVYDQRGYMLFVRGDRSVNGTTITTPNNTTLRTKGNLFKGNVSIPLPGDNLFASLGNPYASTIDMRKVTQTTGSTFFYLWNPSLTGAYGYGAYEAYSYDGANYVRTPGDGTQINNFIQSGQAFFVQTTTTAGSINFTEASKSNGSTITYFRPQGTPSVKIAQLRANLYSINADSAILDDGTLQQFSDDYSNNIDAMDARKLFNSSENLAVKSGGKYLVIERRHTIDKADTIFFSLTGVKAQSYRLIFLAEDLSGGADGFIEDTYLHTQTPLNTEGNTEINFTVTSAPGSYAANRFRIVFAPMAGPVPVTFVSVNASLNDDNDIAVAWKVENENNMSHYEVEKSIDGSRFTQAATVSVNNLGAGVYSWLDENATPGYQYYRIKSVDNSGKIAYTQVVKVLLPAEKPEIAIRPNPITDGIIHLQLINQAAGKYAIRLLNPLGQIIVSKQVTHAGGNSTQLINWNYRLAHGIYQLEITKPGGEVKVIKVIY